MSADRDESFLTVADVADWFKVNQQTVRNWIDQGRLPAVRVGRRVRIRRSDFDRILEGGSRGTGSSPSSGPGGRMTGPSAVDFWSGEPVGAAEPDPSVTETSKRSGRPSASPSPKTGESGSS
jgi:excisionase family DNA binding protein